MKTTLIIADDDFNYSKTLFNSLKNFEKDITILGIATDGKETLTMLEKYNPHFLILDLKMPKKSGIEVLQELEKKKNCQTKVIITSGEVELVNELNLVKYNRIENIFIKPFKFSLLFKSIQNNYERTNSKQLEIYIDEFLHNFNFNFTSQSYKYLIACIEKAINKPHVLNEIYKEIAEEENINLNKIKWGIQKLIASMNRYTSKEIISKYITYNQNPSPKIFIFEAEKRIKQKLSSQKLIK
ncbi:MAG: response regulator [Clostridia bacterium]|jgi:response regulator of citrate/malate metabolism|nr:response regulator [Clostridia bacterium]